MVEISRNLMSYRALMPNWFSVLLVSGGLFISFVMYFGYSMYPLEAIIAIEQNSAYIAAPPKQSGRNPASVESSPPVSEFIVASIINKPAIVFGIAFCSVAAVISALVLLLSLPVFLFSPNAERVARAGGLVKTTLGFFIGSAGAIIATISLAPV